MDNLQIPPNKSTPKINFVPATGIFEISGRSIHENPVIFYYPILEWLTEYVKNPNKHTTLHIDLDYFNTTSSKCLLDIFKTICQLPQTGNTISIKWHYEKGDEDLLEAGEEFQAILEHNFEFLEKI